MGPLSRITLATVAFAAVHSLLASRGAKAVAAGLVGERARDAWYRPFFIVQATVATVWWARVVLRQPDHDLWRAPPLVVPVLVAGQAIAVRTMWRAARTVGLGALTGATGARAWLRDGIVPVPQEAQGPAPTARGMDARGPFRRSRHPLNAAPILVLWLQPRVTRNRFAVTVLATVYFVIGSWHEEHRLRAAYGKRYRGYRTGGAGFLA